jgi:hypothetical protein
MTASRRTALIVCLIGSLLPGGRPCVDILPSSVETPAFRELTPVCQVRASRPAKFPLMPQFDANELGDEVPDPENGDRHEVSAARAGSRFVAILHDPDLAHDLRTGGVLHRRNRLITNHLRC